MAPDKQDRMQELAHQPETAGHPIEEHGINLVTDVAVPIAASGAAGAAGAWVQSKLKSDSPPPPPEPTIELPPGVDRE